MELNEGLLGSDKDGGIDNRKIPLHGKQIKRDF
jgi:hypothetical protein